MGEALTEQRVRTPASGAQAGVVNADAGATKAITKSADTTRSICL